MITPFQQSRYSAPNMHSSATVVGRSWIGSIVIAAWLGLLVMGMARAVDIPPLSEIQPEIAAAHPELVKEREALLKERKALLDRTNSHNKSCNQVEEGSAAEASCTQALSALMSAANSHIQVSKQFNDNLNAAVNLAASKKPAPTMPSGDPNVVDARNVPSGLPKALDNAIAGAYSDAPPGVLDRVRKGFQAVMARDWKVAKAWFEDALNRDPNNPGLKRFVALSDPSQQPSQPPPVVDDRNEPAGLGGKSDFKGAFASPDKTKPASASATEPQVQLPDPNDIYLLFPGMKAMDDKEALDILFGLDAQPPSSKSEETK